MALFLAAFLPGHKEGPRTQQGPAHEPGKVDPVAGLSSIPDEVF